MKLLHWDSVVEHQKTQLECPALFVQAFAFENFTIEEMRGGWSLRCCREKSYNTSLFLNNQILQWESYEVFIRTAFSVRRNTQQSAFSAFSVIRRSSRMRTSMPETPILSVDASLCYPKSAYSILNSVECYIVLYLFI